MATWIFPKCCNCGNNNKCLLVYHLHAFSKAYSTYNTHLVVETWEVCQLCNSQPLFTTWCHFIMIQQMMMAHSQFIPSWTLLAHVSARNSSTWCQKQCQKLDQSGPISIFYHHSSILNCWARARNGWCLPTMAIAMGQVLEDPMFFFVAGKWTSPYKKISEFWGSSKFEVVRRLDLTCSVHQVTKHQPSFFFQRTNPSTSLRWAQRHVIHNSPGFCWGAVEDISSHWGTIFEGTDSQPGSGSADVNSNL